MNLRLAALQATFWSALQQASDRLVRLPVFLILARILAPEAFGLIALAQVYIEFAILVQNQGLTSAIVQRQDLRAEHLESVFWGNLTFSIVLTLASLAIAAPFAQVVDQPSVAVLVRGLSPIFVLSAFVSVQDALLRRELRFKVVATRTLLSQLVAGAFGVVLALLGAGIWSLVAIPLVSQAIAAVFLWQASKWRPRWSFSFQSYRELFGFGVSMMSLSLLVFWRQRTDNLLIGATMGAASLGFYSMARQLMQGVTSLAYGTVGPVLWSTLSRLQREPDRLVRAVYQAGEMLALWTWPAYLGVAALAPELVTVLLGDPWLPIVPLVRAFTLVAVASSLATPILTAITAVGEARRRLKIEVIVTVITLFAVVAALPFGMVAVAWAFAGSFSLVVPIQLWVAARILPISIPEYLARYLPPGAASVAMMVAILGLKGWLSVRVEGPGLLLSLVVIGALVYIGVLGIAFPAIMHRAIENLRHVLAFRTHDG